jgi:hypothetical protein
MNKELLENLAANIAEANDILGAYLDGKPTVEIDKELANEVSYAAYCAEELISLVNSLKEERSELFED